MNVDISDNVATRSRRSKLGWAFLVPFVVTIGAGLALAGLTGSGDEPAHASSVAAGSSSESAAPQGETAPPWDRLTPEREQLPQLPARSELESAAAQLPEQQRQSVWPGDKWFGLPEYWDGPAHPVFSVADDTLVGVMVSSVGLVELDVYEDPEVDFEELLIDRIGVDQYQEQRQQLADAYSCIEELGENEGLADENSGSHAVLECLNRVG